MQMTQSIRRTLQKSIITFSVLMAIAWVLLLVGYAWVVEDNIFNRLVSKEASYLQEQYQLNERIAEPRFPFMRLYEGWQALPTSIQLLREASPARIEFPTDEGGTLHVQVIELGTKEWILAADVTGFEVSRDYLPRLLPWFFGAIFLVLTLACWLSRYLGKRITDPIVELSESLQAHAKAKEHSALALRERFDQNEIGYLASIIEGNMNALQLALERETDFTRDISHELRTPTSLLKMRLERLLAESKNGVEPLRALQEPILEIENTIDVLLAIARSETAERESISLLTAVEKSILNHQTFMEQSPLEVQIDISPKVRVTANHNLLNILLNNLISNVVQHASVPAIQIKQHKSTLCLSNPISEQAPDNVLEPMVKSENSPGIGQGLHLVKRICDLYGWQLTHQVEDGHFLIRILFK